ncbi:MAG: hypothetical protein A2825_02810 [Candidatus Taylorbacteria bacterium RIFCSPHIGHO2_01_FULL_43_120]|nr:MAG: hypothetical protein A2825_02810 [Candidatus Taylorbacteria bacterium RIFCSPHIGHO2_01_FULL_43_120]
MTDGNSLNKPNCVSPIINKSAVKKVKIDKIFLIITLCLVLFGALIFTSAALGLLAGSGAKYSDVAVSHIVFGIGLGLIAMVFSSRFDYKHLRKYSFYLYISALALTFLVFVPGLNFEHGGAKRWIDIAGVTFQPSEFLKLAFVIYLAAWLAAMREKVSTVKFGFLPFLILLATAAAALLPQPDTDTFLIIFAAGLGMFLIAGAKIRHILTLGAICVVLVGALAFTRPYVMERIKIFINPAANPQGSGYQIRQSLIAIGSGEIFGRGFGQSIQKFDFLPEPIGDSIFAVAAEEFGFVGSVLLIMLYTAFAVRGFKIASRAPDRFSGLLVTGIVILIISQSFLNISAMLGVLPLSGLPLLFVSHGGTAMLVTLFAVGIVLNISKYQRNS